MGRYSSHEQSCQQLISVIPICVFPPTPIPIPGLLSLHLLRAGCGCLFCRPRGCLFFCRPRGWSSWVSLLSGLCFLVVLVGVFVFWVPSFSGVRSGVVGVFARGRDTGCGEEKGGHPRRNHGGRRGTNQGRRRGMNQGRKRETERREEEGRATGTEMLWYSRWRGGKKAPKGSVRPHA